jgi:hypothetical protein
MIKWEYDIVFVNSNYTKKHLIEFMNLKGESGWEIFYCKKTNVTQFYTIDSHVAYEYELRMKRIKK